MASENLSGDGHPHQQVNCCCKGSNWVAALISEQISEIKSSIEELKSGNKEAWNQVLSYLQKLAPSPTTSSIPSQGEPSAPRRYYLDFKGKLPGKLFTKHNIEDMGASLEVVLLDESGKRVEDGPESSSMIQIDVLDGGFDVEVKNDWTVEEHKENVAMPRKDRGPLLKDNRIISLSRGVASVCNISFTDNSSTVGKNGMFRLGARIKEGLPYGEFVRSAVSKKFKVIEVRGKDYQKHPVPSLDDPIWRLENICEPGKYFSRAKDNNVHTVKDFLQLYNTDEKKLREILGRFHEAKWGETVKNARACKLTPKRLRYYDDASGDDLLLDCAFNIIAIKFKGETTQLYESLGLKQKEKADKLRQAAYEKRDELEIFDDPTDQVPPGPPMDPSVGGLREYPDASLSSDKIGSDAHMLYPDAIAADQDCLLQNSALTTSVCLTADDSGVFPIVSQEQADEPRSATYPIQSGLATINASTNHISNQELTSPSIIHGSGSLLSNQTVCIPPTYVYHDATTANLAYQDCLLQNMALTKSVCLTTDDSGEQTVKLSQAAYERQDKLENFDGSTNQVTVQAGLTYPHSVQQQVQGEQEQNQAPALPPLVSYPTSMQCIDTTAADLECFWQSTENTTFMGLMTDASEMNNPSHGNETWNVNDIFNEPDSLISLQTEIGSPGFYRSFSMMLRSSQGGTEVQQECCYSSSSNVQASPSLFTENGAFPEDTHTIYNPDKLRIKNSRWWCKIRVQLKSLTETIKETHCRPTKKQRLDKP